MRLAALTLLLAIAVAPAAWAGMPVDVKKTCAIGGEKFTHVETASYSTWGARPDGKPYGSWTFPLALPVCPGNGLVMYRDFTAEEKAPLTALIAGPEYRALVADKETPYFRAAWLEARLKPGSDDAPWILLRATWETDDDAARQARYDRAFVEAVDAAPAKPDDLTWAVLQARAANAERQLGNFEAAARRLAAVDRAVFKRRSNDPKPDPDADNRPYWAEYYGQLDAVIARRDASREPLDMIGERAAVWKCKEMADRSKAQPAGFCETPKMQKMLKGMAD